MELYVIECSEIIEVVLNELKSIINFSESAMNLFLDSIIGNIFLASPI